MAQEFGKYQLLKKLATGGMAEVWLARQVGIGGFQRDVVLKRILPHLAEDADFIDMFQNEARIAARFNHPNIAQINELGEVDGVYFIAMEYIHGRDLGRVMRRAWNTGQWLTPPLAIRIISSCCEGLYYAHHRTDDDGRPLQVVHRDISPQNILISFDGSVKVVDFGIAKAADQVSNTRSGAIKGKFAYMSPEQAGGKPLDHRADLYSIGLVLYELLTGQRPLKRENEIATLQAAMEGRIEPPSAVSEVAPELDTVVMRALARDRADRYRDARQFQLALEEHLVGQRMVVTSAQISELMETLFKDDLDEEAKQGQPMPPVSSPGHSFPGLTTEPPASSLQGGTAVARRSGSRNELRATGERKVARPPPPPSEAVAEWDAPPAAEIPGRRRTGETRSIMRSRLEGAPDSTRSGRTPSAERFLEEELEPEETRAKPATRVRRVSLPEPSELPDDDPAEATRLPPPPDLEPRRAPSRLEARAFDLSERQPSDAHEAVTEGPEAYLEDLEDEPEPQLEARRDPDATGMGPMPSKRPPRRKRRPRPREADAPGQAPRPGGKRRRSQVAAPQAPGPLVQWPRPGQALPSAPPVRLDSKGDPGPLPDELSSVARYIDLEAHQETSNKRLKGLVVVALVAAVGVLGFVFHDPIWAYLRSSQLDTQRLGRGVLLTVETNVPVDVWVRRGDPGPDEPARVKLGSGRRLERIDGARLQDTVVLVNERQGVEYEHEIAYGQPGDEIVIRKEFGDGAMTLHLQPETLSELSVYRGPHLVGKYMRSGQRIELMEGRHRLELRGKQLREPYPFEVEVKRDRITPARHDLQGLLK